MSRGKGKEIEDDLIDFKVSTVQCKLAIDALLKNALAHQAAKEQNLLLPDRTEQYIWLVVAVKKMFPERKLKPFKIPLSHPLIDPRTTAICLITKDPQREYKDLLESNNVKFISRVVGIQKLRGKFKPFEARRILLRENGLFLADDRVIPLLPKLLGKPFFNAKKQPIPVCLRRKDLKGELERAVSSTYFHQNQGTCSSIKIGVLGQHSSTQLLQNLSTALPHVVKNIRENWDNVQSIHIKTSSSASLPVWNCRLDEEEGGRWDGLTRVPILDDMGEEAEGGKGKKRSLIPAEQSANKKAKSGATIKKSISTPVLQKESKHPAASTKPPKATGEKPTSRYSTKPPLSQLHARVKEKPARATAVDSFDSSNPGGRVPPSRPSDSKATVSRNSSGLIPSPDFRPEISKPESEKPLKTKTILKSPNQVAQTSTTGVQSKGKHVKFAAKFLDSKTRKDKPLGLTNKKVRSGGGKNASVKDRLLRKKDTVK